MLLVFLYIYVCHCVFCANKCVHDILLNLQKAFEVKIQTVKKLQGVYCVKQIIKKNIHSFDFLFLAFLIHAGGMLGTGVHLEIGLIQFN